MSQRSENNISYFDWLFDLIKNKNSQDLKEFISDLHHLGFYCIVPNDDNRIQDAFELRKRYLIDFPNGKVPERKSSLSCSMLELLIALAERMDFILNDGNNTNRIHWWFWLFIDNLKLQKYTSYDADKERKKEINQGIIRKLVEREYSGDGNGGIFPLNYPYRNQQRLELWYQMMDYINENYDF